MPAPNDGCSVCFYQQAHSAGSKFCIGKRTKASTNTNSIQTPRTIESIKFSKDCELVVNMCMMDPLYGEHVDVISTDVVQVVCVEEAGCTCFLGVPDSANGYSRCYTAAVESQYRNVFTERMFFKTRTKNFDVIAYVMDNFNRANSSAQSHRFTGYRKALEDGKDDHNTGMKQTMQHKVRSIVFATAAGYDKPPTGTQSYKQVK